MLVQQLLRLLSEQTEESVIFIPSLISNVIIWWYVYLTKLLITVHESSTSRQRPE